MGRNWTDDGASAAGAAAIEPLRFTRINRVARAFIIRRAMTTTEVSCPEIGGSEGTRRIRDLRGVGWIFTVDPILNSTQFLYTLVALPTKEIDQGYPELDLLKAWARNGYDT